MVQLISFYVALPASFASHFTSCLCPSSFFYAGSDSMSFRLALTSAPFCMGILLLPSLPQAIYASTEQSHILPYIMCAKCVLCKWLEWSWLIRSSALVCPSFAYFRKWKNVSNEKDDVSVKMWMMNSDQYCNMYFTDKNVHTCQTETRLDWLALESVQLLEGCCGFPLHTILNGWFIWHVFLWRLPALGLPRSSLWQMLNQREASARSVGSLIAIKTCNSENRFTVLLQVSLCTKYAELTGSAHV